MTSSRTTVSVPIAVALKIRFLVHGSCAAVSGILPMLVYDWLFYKNFHELSKYNLPTDCVFSAADGPWWTMIPPVGIMFAGFALYWISVWFFSNRKNNSGIVSLVRKNINSDELVQLKI
ncbi:MAG: hypothetical protein F4W92_07065 [Gammaproteobacteria bacterium]|nr:hypothetical protein [Gammaproteobacteria bacterium]